MWLMLHFHVIWHLIGALFDQNQILKYEYFKIMKLPVQEVKKINAKGQ